MSSGRSPVIHVAAAGVSGAFDGAKGGTSSPVTIPSSPGQIAMPMDVIIFDTGGYTSTGSVTILGFTFVAGTAFTAPRDGYYQIGVHTILSDIANVQWVTTLGNSPFIGINTLCEPVFLAGGESVGLVVISGTEAAVAYGQLSIQYLGS